MVASRRKPTAPAPSTPRTNSTQALARAVNAKPADSESSTISDDSSDLFQSYNSNIPNGMTTSKANQKSRKSKSGITAASRNAKRSTFLDRLFVFLLATFVAYALYTCPFDVNHESPVCRSMATYRTYVLEPYVVPPIRAVITHPVVQQQYDNYAKPVYDNYIQPVTPYIAAAQRHTAPYLNGAVNFSKRSALRVWNNIVLPYWTRAVVPRYHLYIQPHVNKYVSPITKRIHYYNRKAEPYVRTFLRRISVYSHNAQERTVAVYVKVKPHAIRTYRIVKPYATHAYAKAKPFLYRALKEIQMRGQSIGAEIIKVTRIAWGRIGGVRREYVDPHVLRIYEKAVEKSGSSHAHSNNVATAVPKSTILDEVVPNADTDHGGATAESTMQPTAITPVESIPSPSTTVDATTKLSERPQTSDASADPTPPATPEETLAKAESIAEESAGHASSVIGKLVEEIKSAEAEQVLLSITPTPAESHMPTAPELPIRETTEVVESLTQNSSPSVETSIAAEDLDEFLRDIGLNEVEVEATESESDAAPEPTDSAQPEQDEEARKAEVAAKRANIVTRHVRWQSQLDALVKDLERRVVKEIETIRQDAVKDMGTLPSDKSRERVEGKGQEVIDKIQNEGAKLLKGLETYVKKLAERDIAREELEKETEKWNKVLDKVEDKFRDAIRSAQGGIHGWYNGVREKEIESISRAVKQAISLADRAQSDLGLDYAWLDDVTYQDWQKYHDLRRTCDRFEQRALAMQNGTHESSPEDSLTPVLINLEREVQDMIGGFAVKMNSFVREGNRLLQLTSESEPEEECEEEECEEEQETRVSISPISPTPTPEVVDPANVIIGKSKEQVESVARQAAIDGRIEL